MVGDAAGDSSDRYKPRAIVTHETVEACYNTLELFENEKVLLAERTRMWVVGKWSEGTGFNFPKETTAFCTISLCAIGTS